MRGYGSFGHFPQSAQTVARIFSAPGQGGTEFCRSWRRTSPTPLRRHSRTPSLKYIARASSGTSTATGEIGKTPIEAPFVSCMPIATAAQRKNHAKHGSKFTEPSRGNAVNQHLPRSIACMNSHPLFRGFA
jgi:hypothetical protein